MSKVVKYENLRQSRIRSKYAKMSDHEIRKAYDKLFYSLSVEQQYSIREWFEKATGCSFKRELVNKLYIRSIVSRLKIYLGKVDWLNNRNKDAARLFVALNITEIDELVEQEFD